MKKELINSLNFLSHLRTDSLRNNINRQYAGMVKRHASDRCYLGDRNDKAVFSVNDNDNSGRKGKNRCGASAP